MRVRWSDRAVADLSEIRDHIGEDSETNAIALLERLFVAVENLERFPNIGRQVPEAARLQNVRELIVNRYRVIYRHQSDKVEIVMVIHGRRNLVGLSPKSWK